MKARRRDDAHVGSDLDGPHRQPAAGPATGPVQLSVDGTGASPEQLARFDTALVQLRAAVQARAETTAPSTVQDVAAAGFEGSAQQVPHLETIQRAFGRHDVRSARAHVGGPAAEASQTLGAEAYAAGDRVAFAGAPSLHIAAHEAAHLVQQRGGVQLAKGVGRAGDGYERHADQVADAVVAGRSAERLLDEAPGGPGAASGGQATPPQLRRDGPVQLAAPKTYTQADVLERVKSFDKGDPKKTYQGMVKVLWAKGRQAGETALAASEQLPAIQQKEEVLVAVLAAIRDDLVALNNRRHPGCDLTTEIILGLLATFQVQGVKERNRQHRYRGHTYPYFPGIDKGLKHGDDPYSRALTGVSAKDLLLDKKAIDSHWKRDAEITEQVEKETLSESSGADDDRLKREIVAALPKVQVEVQLNPGQGAKEHVFFSIDVAEVVGHPDVNPSFFKYSDEAAADSAYSVQQLVSQVQLAAKQVYNQVGKTKADALRLLVARLKEWLLRAIVLRKAASPRSKDFAKYEENEKRTFGLK